MPSRIAVIDFETTGSSPGQGARATEVAIVLVEHGAVVGSFQSLMNAGAWVPPFITQLTGITNAMVAEAPAAAEVMARASRFVGETPLVAHNAAFDRGFLRAELARAGVRRRASLCLHGAAVAPFVPRGPQPPTRACSHQFASAKASKAAPI